MKWALTPNSVNTVIRIWVKLHYPRVYALVSQTLDGRLLDTVAVSESSQLSTIKYTRCIQLVYAIVGKRIDPDTCCNTVLKCKKVGCHNVMLCKRRPRW